MKVFAVVEFLWFLSTNVRLMLAGQNPEANVTQGVVPVGIALPQIGSDELARECRSFPKARELIEKVVRLPNDRLGRSHWQVDS